MTVKFNYWYVCQSKGCTNHASLKCDECIRKEILKEIRIKINKIVHYPSGEIQYSDIMNELKSLEEKEK